jgi:hypothetical protein
MNKLMLAIVIALAFSGAAVVAVESPLQAGCPKHNPNC